MILAIPIKMDPGKVPTAEQINVEVIIAIAVVQPPIIREIVPVHVAGVITMAVAVGVADLIDNTIVRKSVGPVEPGFFLLLSPTKRVQTASR